MADRGNIGNILDEHTNKQLVDRDRFNRAGLNYLETVFGPALVPATMRHKSLPAMDKLLITLRYLATGGKQLNDADMHNVSQPAVSKILTEVTNYLSSADVLGRNLFNDGHVPNGQYHLLGDSGYAGRRWLLTPYLNPQPGSQTAYNRSNKITRAKVERGIGQLKRRFGVLHGEIRVQPEKACRIVLTCAVLHNICKAQNIPMPDVIDDGGNANNMDNNIAPQHGMQYRDYFANTYF
ncbi:HARB1-like protein [Mya arenaria]|uniref:HARB1-like protein n=1 Tax=Mya arenaria TaxID=6604 RepID=A0ABY7EL37_MYAAR|nr:HARB1-like protein [Mya arenaria]